LQRIIAACRCGNISAEDGPFLAHALEQFLSHGEHHAACLGLPPSWRTQWLLEIRDAMYLEMAACLKGSARQKARQLSQHLLRHPQLRPPGRVLGFDALRKLLAGQSKPSPNSPPAGVKSEP